MEAVQAAWFWERVAKSDGCWEWTRGKNRGGYGKFRTRGRHGKFHRAHRAAWELTNGPIPDGLCVCHRCDNPPCCNPAHLFLGTQAENLRDMVAKGRGPSGAELGRRSAGEANGNRKLTALQVSEILARLAQGQTSVSIAAAYGVDRSNIRLIANGKTWRRVSAGGQVSL